MKKKLLGCLCIAFLIGMFCLFYTKEHEAVALPVEEFKKYIVENCQTLREGNSKLAKQIGFQLAVKKKSLVEINEGAANELAVLENLEATEKERQKEIANLVQELKSRSEFTSDLPKAQKFHREISSQIDTLQEENVNLEEKAVLLKKIDAQNTQEISAKESQIKANQQKIQDLKTICNRLKRIWLYWKNWKR